MFGECLKIWNMTQIPKVLERSLDCTFNSNSVTRRLSHYQPLRASEVSLVLQSCRESVKYPPSSTISLNTTDYKFVMSGWACRQWVGLDGRQQLVDFLLPGDVLHPVSGLTCGLSLSVVTLTPMRLASGNAVQQAIEADGEAYRALKSSLVKSKEAESMRLYDSLIRLGTLSAMERLLDLLVEFYQRLEPVHLASRGRFECALTQGTFADALGTSAIHMNRTFKLLEKCGKITREPPWVYLHDLSLPWRS